MIAPRIALLALLALSACAHGSATHTVRCPGDPSLCALRAGELCPDGYTSREIGGNTDSFGGTRGYSPGWRRNADGAPFTGALEITCVSDRQGTPAPR
jgi:hypothetical protein